MIGGRTSRALLGAALAMGLLLDAAPALAGCGCTKPPPPSAALRPHVTHAGSELTVFPTGLMLGAMYEIRFQSGTGPESASVSVPAVMRRDLSDGALGPQLVVTVPDLPLGPAAIEVRDAGGNLVTSLDDSSFTVAPQPIAIPDGVGESVIEGYQAAVSRDGAVYVTLDFTAIRDPRLLRAQLLGYPLHFDSDDLAFYNRQGFLMQLLDDSMPGLFALGSTSGQDSDELRYSRHEFNTYFLQHEEREVHAVDPADPNWHLDGTPHIDHDHQVLEIVGTLPDGSPPAPGATPAADLMLASHTLFHHGLLGGESVDMRNYSRTDSYDSRTGVFEDRGVVVSPGWVELKDYSRVDGDVASPDIVVHSDAVVTGSLAETIEEPLLLPVQIPAGLQDLGKFELSGDDALTLGVGSYRLDSFTVRDDASLHIDNTDGPVSLYIDGNVYVKNRATITTSDPDPEKFAIYVAGSRKVEFRNGSGFVGVVYAPDSQLMVLNDAEYFGSFVGRTVSVRNRSIVHFDEALRGD